MFIIIPPLTLRPVSPSPAVHSSSHPHLNADEFEWKVAWSGLHIKQQFLGGRCKMWPLPRMWEVQISLDRDKTVNKRCAAWGINLC